MRVAKRSRVSYFAGMGERATENEMGVTLRYGRPRLVVFIMWDELGRVGSDWSVGIVEEKKRVQVEEYRN